METIAFGTCPDCKKYGQVFATGGCSNCICPKCKTVMEQRRHRFSSYRGPNMPDADWLECPECGFQTDPE